MVPGGVHSPSHRLKTGHRRPHLGALFATSLSTKPTGQFPRRRQCRDLPDPVSKRSAMAALDSLSERMLSRSHLPKGPNATPSSSGMSSMLEMAKWSKKAS